ncbi:MAG TPA: hypothetical protein PLT20_01110 [Sedimentisphaerales bacterium]|nr:hypothetical protein [Sedimentisphaerales bacterium]HQI26655.1 hypothetical protein [Sedimentisphaerales bacterium]
MKRALVLAALVIGCLTASSQAYVTLYVDGDGYSSNFSDWPSSGPDWQKVDEVGTHDGNASYIYSSTNGAVSMFTFQDLDLPLGATIDYITVNAVMRFDDTNMRKGYFGIRTGGTNYWGTLVTSSSNGWNTYSQTYFTNPNGGGAWTDSAIDSLQAGFRVGYESSSGLKATQITVDVYYTLAQEPDPVVTPATVPAPISIMLTSLGTGLVGWLRRRNAV